MSKAYILRIFLTVHTHNIYTHTHTHILKAMMSKDTTLPWESYAATGRRGHPPPTSPPPHTHTQWPWWAPRTLCYPHTHTDIHTYKVTMMSKDPRLPWESYAATGHRGHPGPPPSAARPVDAERKSPRGSSPQVLPPLSGPSFRSEKPCVVKSINFIN